MGLIHLTDFSIPAGQAPIRENGSWQEVGLGLRKIVDVYIYIYRDMCIYIYTHMHTHTYLYAYIDLYIYVSKRAAVRGPFLLHYVIPTKHLYSKEDTESARKF